MNVKVKRNAQFPKGVLDLRGLEGGETILLDAGLLQTIWLAGRATGQEALFGTMQIHVSQGPHGFGMQIGRSAGDAPMAVATPNTRDLEATDVEVYELVRDNDIHSWSPRERGLRKRRG